MTNAEMVTGEIEVQPTSLEVLSQAGELPFSINHENAVSEELRLEHRYLDLRRQSNREMLRLRHHLTIDIMNFFDAEGFTYIETPTFVKNTPE
jgi:aspartyl-tRNA synthetase